MPRPAPSPTFAGFSSPTYTPVPDELFDTLLPHLTDAELRVLLYIIRRTFGFKRETDAISLSQMVRGITTRDGRVLDSGTGLSKATVARGLAGLRTKQIVLAERNRSPARGDEPTTYRLHLATDRRPPVSRPRDTPRVAATRQAVSHPRDTQQRGTNSTERHLSNGETRETDDTGREAAAFDQLPPPDVADGLTAIAATLPHHVRAPRATAEDRLAIGAAVDRIAADLGDRADRSVSLARAMNLFAAAAVSRDGFIDLLDQVRGAVRDRRQFPGNAPVPVNQMAYFFAVVEDRLGMRPDGS